MKSKTDFWVVLIFIAVAGVAYLAAPSIFHPNDDYLYPPQKEVMELEKEEPDILTNEEWEAAQEEVSPEPVEEPSPPTYKEILEKVIKEAKHSSYYFKEPKTFEIIDLEDEHVGFHFTCFIDGKDLFTSSRETILRRIFLFYKTLYTSPECSFVYGASLSFYVAVLDDYGNIKKHKVANAILYRKIADKIRWGNLDMANDGERLVRILEKDGSIWLSYLK